jgi:hypothetical protein
MHFFFAHCCWGNLTLLPKDLKSQESKSDWRKIPKDTIIAGLIIIVVECNINDLTFHLFGSFKRYRVKSSPGMTLFACLLLLLRITASRTDKMIDFKTIIEMCWSKSLDLWLETKKLHQMKSTLTVCTKRLSTGKNKSSSPSDFALSLTNSLCANKKEKQKHKIDQASVKWSTKTSHEYLILQPRLHLWKLLKNVTQFIKQNAVSKSLKGNKNASKNPRKQYWSLFTHSML